MDESDPTGPSTPPAPKQRPEEAAPPDATARSEEAARPVPARPDASGSDTPPSRPRAYWTVGVGKGELRFEPSRSALPGEVLIEALYGAVSRGTEGLVFRGEVPISEFARMRGPNQAGDFPFPVKYGYCLVGRVIDGPRLLRDRRVLVLHPHQDRLVIEAEAAVPLPDNVPSRRAVLGPNMETALNVLWDSGVAAGDRVAVVGAGTVGALVARLAARIPGTEVALIDVQPSRRIIAETLGARFATPIDAPLLFGRDFDVVVHASATAEGLTTALGLAGSEATVVEASWYGARSVAVPLGEAFHARRLRIVSSQVGRVPPQRVPRWDARRRLTTALELLDDPALDVLLAEPVAFADLPAAMPRILAGGPGAPCAVIVYPAAERGDPASVPEAPGLWADEGAPPGEIVILGA